MEWEKIACEAAQEVINILGPSYAERVYEDAFLHELRLRGIPYERQRNIEILYKKHRIGERRPDCILNPHWSGGEGDEFLVEIKAVKKITNQHLLQAQVYLSSMNIPEGIILNFNPGTGCAETRRITKAEKVPGPPKPDISTMSTRPKNLMEALLIAANEVLRHLGTEFSYYSSDIYVSAVGIELRLMGFIFHKASHPILYKDHPVDEYTYDYVFGTGEVAKILSYKDEKKIQEAAEEMRSHNKTLGIKNGFILALPQEESCEPVVKEV